MKLNLGCGNDYKNGWVNVDNFVEKVDVKHDLNKFPYPFEDNTFKEVKIEHVLEHLKDLISVMDELHRICKDGAIIKIGVPHWSSNSMYRNPTHCQFFHTLTFVHWDTHPEKYSKNRFVTKEVKILANGSWFWNLNKFTQYLFEMWGCKWLPEIKQYNFLEFILEVKK